MKVIRNQPEGTQFSAPVKDGGGLYAFELVTANKRAYADTPHELLSFLIPGYRDCSTEFEFLTARIRHAVQTAAALQAVLNDLYADADVTDEQAQVLQSGGLKAMDTWDCAVPLILVDSMFAPTTDVDRPLPGDGTLLWLEPEDEFEYLLSLHALGAIAVNVSTERNV